MLNRDEAIRTAALLAIESTYDKAEVYTRNMEAMGLHSVAVAWDKPELLKIRTGLTACTELNYALNRIDSYTAAAMVAEMQRRTEAAAACRRMASAWTVYYEDADRSEQANNEDDERCARAEAADYARLDEFHR